VVQPFELMYRHVPCTVGLAWPFHLCTSHPPPASEPCAAAKGAMGEATHQWDESLILDRPLAYSITGCSPHG